MFDYCDVLRLFAMAFSRVMDETVDNRSIGVTDNAVQCNGSSINSKLIRDNIFLFGGSTKSDTIQ